MFCRLSPILNNLALITFPTSSTTNVDGLCYLRRLIIPQLYRRSRDWRPFGTCRVPPLVFPLVCNNPRGRSSAFPVRIRSCHMLHRRSRTVGARLGGVPLFCRCSFLAVVRFHHLFFFSRFDYLPVFGYRGPAEKRTFPFGPSLRPARSSSATHPHTYAFLSPLSPPGSQGPDPDHSQPLPPAIAVRGRLCAVLLASLGAAPRGWEELRSSLNAGDLFLFWSPVFLLYGPTLWTLGGVGDIALCPSLLSLFPCPPLFKFPLPTASFTPPRTAPTRQCSSPLP